MVTVGTVPKTSLQSHEGIFNVVLLLLFFILEIYIHCCLFIRYTSEGIVNSSYLFCSAFVDSLCDFD